MFSLEVTLYMTAKDIYIYIYDAAKRQRESSAAPLKIGVDPLADYSKPKKKRKIVFLFF